MGKDKPRLKRWSYSLWGAMKKCPKGVKLGKIDGLKEPPNRFMERGTMIHHMAEQFLKGNITGMPKDLVKLKEEYRALKKFKPEHIEEFMTLDRKFKPVRKEGWIYGWFTLKADAMSKPRKIGGKLTAISIDHKTGRHYPTHQEQAELSALVQMKFYPDADVYESEFFYTDQGEVVPYVFKPSYLRKREDFWMAEGEKIMAETKFLPTPSPDACNWCPWRSDKKLLNGKPGPCKDWMRMHDR